MTPRIKVCGVASAEFAAEAARRAVGYLGVIFAAKSPRRVSLETARAVAASARAAAANPPRIVGVFVEQTADEILELARSVPLDVVQLHRRASADDVVSLRAAGLEVWTLAGGAPGDGVLFDSSHGDGETEFRKGEYKAVVAGGISAANVGEALKLEPDVVDVNSSIETAPGVKSVEMLDSLLDEFKKAIER